MKKSLAFILAIIGLGISTSAYALDFSAHGYYRLRFEYTHDLDLQRPNPGVITGDSRYDDNDRFGTIAFAQQRFRLQPTLKLNDHISFHGEIDMLDNLLFGQSDVDAISISNPITGTLALPDANGPFGVTGGVSGSGGNINVRQMYVDVLTSGGKLRIGRQASHFGLGMLTNDGEGMEGDFGDTYDRILYLAGLPLAGGQLTFGGVFDFAFEASRDPSVGGLDTGVGSNWNDAMQTGVILLYKHNNFEVGTFSAVRFRDGNDGQPTTTALDSTGNEVASGIDGDTFLYIIDTYAKAKFAKYYNLGIEAVYIGGKMAPGIVIDAIEIDDPALTNPLENPITIPQTGTQNDISVFMAALEGQAKYPFGGEINLQAGFSQGDSSPLSQRITQFGFRPDYDIALMMFDVPLGTSPGIRVGGETELGRKPITPNYINNAIYFTLEYKHEFDITSGVPWADDFKVGLKGITAFAPSRVIDLDFAEITGTPGLPHVVNASKWYGLEIDASVEAKFFEFMHWKTSVGFFLPGGVYDVKNDAVARATAGVIDPILFDNSEPAIAAKTTLFFEF